MFQSSQLPLKFRKYTIKSIQRDRTSMCRYTGNVLFNGVEVRFKTLVFRYSDQRPILLIQYDFFALEELISHFQTNEHQP